VGRSRNWDLGLGGRVWHKLDCSISKVGALALKREPKVRTESAVLCLTLLGHSEFSSAPRPKRAKTKHSFSSSSFRRRPFIVELLFSPSLDRSKFQLLHILFISTDVQDRLPVVDSIIYCITVPPSDRSLLLSLFLSGIDFVYSCA
jgi:hypothetical protein